MSQARTTINIRGTDWLINGQPTCPGTAAAGQLPNVRMVNAVFEDETRTDIDPDDITNRFIAKIPEYKAHGVLAFTLGLQGGMPGYEGAVNSAFRADGTLKADYLRRVERVIRSCDEQGLVVLLSLYYQRQDQQLRDEAAVREGVVQVCKWIRASGFANVLLEIANEYGHPGFTHRILREAEGIAELIRTAKREAPELLVSASSLGHGRIDRSVADASDFITIHFNETPTGKIPARVRAASVYGKPVLCNEDDKLGEAGAAAQRAAVLSGCSWGFMHSKWNQAYPFRFEGAADDPVVYAEMKKLTTEPVALGASSTAESSASPSSPLVTAANDGEQAIQWVRWETVLISSYEYEHPFEDVSVQVIFSMPGEPDVRTLAYWDGGLQYKISHAFSKPGTWSYRTECSDPTNWGLHGQTGTVRVSAYQGSNPLYRHGFLQVPDQARYLAHADGTPFFWLGDTVWNAFFAAAEDEWKAYVEDRAAKRYSVLQVSLNWDGKGILADRRGNPAQLDDRTWNPAFFRGVDEKIRYANDCGLVVFLNGLHSPTSDSRQEGNRLVSYENYEWYGRMLAARYNGSFVIFSPSFDRPYHEEFDKQAEAIREVTDRHLITQHPNTPYHPPTHTTAEAYYDKPYLSFSMCQSGHNDGDRVIVHRKCIEWNASLWNRPNPKPVVNGEAFYDSGGLTEGLHPKYRGTDRDVRATAYLSWCSGALGYTYGAYGLWNWDSNEAGIDFRTAMRFASSEQMKALALLLEPYAWWKLRPAGHFIVDNPQSWTKRMAMAVADDGSFGLAYMPDNESITVRTEAFAGPVKALFYNPCTGDYVRAAKPVTSGDGGAVTYRRPEDGASGFGRPGGKDWVLVLEVV